MATFKSKMKFLAEDWPDQIWTAASARNRGQGAGWLLPVAALALTGARPISLERGIVFDMAQDKAGVIYLRALIQGAKLLKNTDGTARRGQEQMRICWRISPPADVSHRPSELAAIINALKNSPGKPMTISYDAEAISSRLKEMSREIWPRKMHHISGICYRELFASASKAAGISPVEIAKAMGHLSTESQGRYASRSRRTKGNVSPKNLYSNVKATYAVSVSRSPMARFRAATAIRKATASVQAAPVAKLKIRRSI